MHPVLSPAGIRQSGLRSESLLTTVFYSSGPVTALMQNFPPFCVRIEAKVQPKPRRFHEHLGTAVPQELLVAGRLHVLAQRIHDVGVDVVLRGPGGVVCRSFFPADGAPREHGSSMAQFPRARSRLP